MFIMEHVSHAFNGHKVLDDISLEVETGEIMVIMGASGAGKTTILKCLTGMLVPDSGRVLVEGTDMQQLVSDPQSVFRKKCGMLFQNAALFNSMSVGDNIALPLREHTALSEDVIGIIVKMKLEMVGLHGIEHLMPSELSGGMKKRVGLARAIALDPNIVFYDEPSSGLDPVTRAVIDDLIVNLNRKLHITSVIVTHNLESAFRVADRITMLYNGKVQEVGTVDAIKNTVNPIVRQFIEGSPEGPITKGHSGLDYLTHLLGHMPPVQVRDDI